MTRRPQKQKSSEPNQGVEIVGDKSWEALASLFGPKEKRPLGAGWLTNKEIMKRFGVAECKAGEVVKQLIASGKMERFRGALKNSEGKCSPQYWYRPL